MLWPVGYSGLSSSREVFNRHSSNALTVLVVLYTTVYSHTVYIVIRGVDRLCSHIHNNNTSCYSSTTLVERITQLLCREFAALAS
jgi:hypothetical protein